MSTISSINQVVKQITQACERINTLSCDIEDFNAKENTGLEMLFREQREGQLADLQQMVLILTCLIEPEEDAGKAVSKESGGKVFEQGDFVDYISEEK